MLLLGVKFSTLIVFFRASALYDFDIICFSLKIIVFFLVSVVFLLNFVVLI